LLDWGQVVSVPHDMLLKFALANRALCSRNKEQITQAMIDLGIVLKNPSDVASASDIGITLLDTRNVPGYVINPFQPGNALKKNSILKFPPDLYFIIRSVQLMRGISYGFALDYSLADRWSPYAEAYLQQQGIA
jgi:aarF domain-containing kinase